MNRRLVLLLFSALLLLISSFSTSNGHNITSILAKYPKFSVFNHYLTTTGLAEEINHDMDLTVCAVDNPTMLQFMTRSRPSTNTLRHILSLHVLQAYYDVRMLRHLASSNTRMSTLSADNNHLVFGYPRFVHITDFNGGKVVKFSVKDKRNKEKTAYLVSSVDNVAYNISVVQISGILSAPRASPDLRSVLTAVMDNNSCKLFRKKLSGTLAEIIYRHNVNRGLTIFCPADYAFSKFLPRFEKLSEKDKNTLLLYHALPAYMSIYMLRDTDGIYNTLATDGPNRYYLEIQNAYQGVTLKTNVVTTRIVGRLLDDQPLAIYATDDVLLPQELFKA